MLALFQTKVADKPQSEDKPNKVSRGFRQDLVLKIVKLLKQGQSLFVKGEAGSGKTHLAEAIAAELKSQGLPVAMLSPGTAKEILTGVAESFGIDTNNENDKPLSTTALRDEITEHLKIRSCFLICDNLPQIPAALRLWLDKLYVEGQPILATGKLKPEKDIIFKLVGMELEPLGDEAIKSLIDKTAHNLGIRVDSRELCQKCSGNPGIAIKLVKEANLLEQGLEIKQNEPEHQRWFALDRWIVLLIAMLALFRYAGRDPLLIVGGSAMLLSRFGGQVIRYTPKKS